MGHRAVACNLQLVPRSSTEKEAVKYLKELGLANKDNCLNPEALGATTRLGCPCMVSNTETAYGKRHQLLESGFSIAQSGRAASLDAKLLHPNQCSQYYELILVHCGSVQAQEEAGWLSHCQGAHYYRTLLEAFETWRSMDKVFSRMGT